ncbi:MAG: DUF3500 domain-containing protein [Candidatus Abyssubacteria bacterium]
MAEAASVFLASLSAVERKRAHFLLESEIRREWDYRPRKRKGISLKELDGSQRKLGYALLASGLSVQGNAKALMIMSLETVLRELERPGLGFERDPDLYYVSVFGEPSGDSPWGWRVEGHHLSVNFLVVEGKRIAPTPNFFGANPARVPGGGLEGLRVLAAEEDLARRLLGSLDEMQLKRAVIDSQSPPDIITDNSERVRLDEPKGLSYAEMTESQRGRLMDLVVEYVHRVPRDVAESRMERIEQEGMRYLHFAWAGEVEAGPHYYRVHGPSFLLEYDNTQNNANHIHTVWRDIRDDWGEDLLRRHYRRSHGR